MSTSPRWLLLLAVVQRQDRHAGIGVHRAGHVLPRIGTATEAMFGREDGGDTEALLQQDVQQVAVAHHAGVVGEEGNALALQ